MCLAYAKAEGSGLAMPHVYITASTAVSCSRIGSKYVYLREKLCPFPFVLHLSLAGEGGTASFQGSSFQILFQCCLSNVWRYFLILLPVKSSTTLGLSTPCPAWLWHQVIEDKLDIFDCNQNLLF